MTTPTLLDSAVIAEAIAALSVPRRAEANSFILHAQLELIARIGLLPHVDPAAEDGALARIDELRAGYVAYGEPVAPPATIDFHDRRAAAAALGAAVAAGDLDAVDATVSWIAERATIAEVGELVGAGIVDSLAAAGHAPIGFHLLRTVAGGRLPPTMLRGPLRELARHPDWRVTWFRAGDSPTDPAPLVDPTPLATRLRAVPRLGRPGSDFIFPMMSQAERSGAAAVALAGLDRDAADYTATRRTLLRAAAWSMLHDDATQAPYGWSHCLTMPQGVLALTEMGVEQRTAVAVAGTFVVGFRAAHGTVDLGPLGDRDAGEALDGHDVLDDTELVTFAARHEDAHLVKYTLACLHAAGDDPAWASVYRAAAAHLAEWWRSQPNAH